MWIYSNSQRISGKSGDGKNYKFRGNGIAGWNKASYGKDFCGVSKKAADEVYEMIKKYKSVQDDYEALNKKYIALFAEKSELEYQLEMLRAETELMKKQDGEIRSLHQNARKLKHDIKNHLMVIASYLNEQDYEKAKQYTSDILDKFNGMHSYVETGNSLMNHIINEKLQYAREHGILVKAEIRKHSARLLKTGFPRE